MSLRSLGARTVGFLTATLIVLPASGASRTDETANAVARMICADDRGARLPRKVTIDQPLTTDILAADAPFRLLVAYDPEGVVTRFRGKVIADATRIGPGGSKERLGRIGALQNGSNGAVNGQRIVTGQLRRGDILRWKVRLKKFERLGAGECGVLVVGLGPMDDSCGPYDLASTSVYDLPYPRGDRSVISQGNCSVIGSHRGSARHAYDFALPIGSEVVAARAGTVLTVDDSHPDDTGLPSHDNAIVIEHEDGTLASYVHLTEGGARVEIGEFVAQGQLIGLSGNSGSTSGTPHLHFQVTTCRNRKACGTEPVSFRNAGATPLEAGKVYRAR